MATLKEMCDELDAQMNIVYGEYCRLHRDLNAYAGKALDEEVVPEVNRLLKEIQESFAQLHPAYHFIGTRYPQAINATNHYNDFIEGIKKGGASQDESADS